MYKLSGGRLYGNFSSSGDVDTPLHLRVSTIKNDVMKIQL